MGILRLLALSCALGLIPGYPFVSADPDVTACAELGFPAVACSTCKTIAEIVADEDLTAECMQCCHETKRATKKYTSGRLVYDPRILTEELRRFIGETAADFPKLKTESRRSNEVTLYMFGEGPSASEADTVSIRRWKKDSIVEYLNEHF